MFFFEHIQKIFFTILCVCFFGYASFAHAAATTTLSERGITYTFASSTTYGQFVNGDYWVLAPVTITSISPAFDGVKNGWQVNGVAFTQALDSKITPYNAELMPSFPYTATTSQTIIKALARSDAERLGGCGNSGDGGDRNCLKNASVLTVLTSIPSNDGNTWFRPPFLGTDKTLRYSTSDVNYNLLSSLTPTASAPSLDTVINNMQGPYLDFMQVIQNQFLHPSDYMLDYSADWSNKVSEIALMLNVGSLTEQKRLAVNKFIQIGIDEYGEILAGASWKVTSTGGHGNGRVLPIAYAATLLNDAPMKTLLSAAPSNNYFAETGMLQWSENPTSTPRKVIFGETASEYNYWATVAGTAFVRTALDPYKMIDGGPFPGASYQGCCTSMPWKGTVISLKLLPLAQKIIYGIEKTVRYVDRWVTVGALAQSDTCAPYDGNINNYGITFGPDGNGGCIKDTNPANGTGRFPDKQGYSRDDGGRQSSFVNEMYAAYATLNGDLTPPLIYNGTPQGLLPATTTSVTLSINTDEAATCRYAASSTLDYASMTAFSSTGGTSHTATVSGLTPDTSYSYYAKCQDGLGNTNLEPYALTFSIDSPFSLSDGLLLYLTYDTASLSGTSTVLDQSGQGNNGTLTGTSSTTTLPQIVTGIVNQAVMLDGIGNRINLPTATAVAPTSSITVSAWAKNNLASVNGIQTIIGRGTTDTSAGFVTYNLSSTGGTNLTFTIGNGSTTRSLTVVVTDWTQWRYVVGTFNATTGFMGLYVNGSLVNSSTDPTFTILNPTTGGMQTRIGSEGRTSTRRFWAGSIDDTRVWNRALSASEVAKLYSSMTPPVLSNISAGNPTESAATISWTTNIPATSQVEYGLTASYTASSTFIAATTTPHTINLTGLTASTTYHYRVLSLNSYGMLATSTDQVFTTAATPVDAPPSVMLNAPAGNSTVSGITTLMADATDDGQVLGVKFVLDGVTLIGSEDTTFPYGVSWDTSVVSNGIHTLRAVARDNGGNVATSSPVSVTVSNAGPDTTPPVISAIATSTTQTTATITWTTDEAATDALVYGLTTVYGATSTNAVATTSHAITITGLTAATTYNFKIFSTDTSTNTASTTNLTFRTQGLGVTRPTVTAQAAGGVGTTSAILNGTITFDGNASSTDRGFNYGTTTAYGIVASTTGTFGTGAFTQSISGLLASTTYFFQAFATNASGTATSTGLSFTTGSLADTTAPVISNIISSTTPYGATVSWTTDELANSFVVYGLTTGYGLSSSTLDTSTTHTITLTGLAPQTTYQYQIRSSDASGNLATSSNRSFTTPFDNIPPVFSNITLMPMAKGFTVTWTTNEPATTQVSLGTTTPYSASTALDPAFATDHSVTVSDLDELTLYNLAVLGTDIYNNTATSSNQVVTTLAATQTSGSGSTGGGGGTSNGGGGGGGGGSNSVTASSTVVIPRSIPPALPAQAQVFVFTRNLAPKDTVSDVKRLQAFLVIKGYLPNTSITGYYGPQTHGAVKRYQKEKGIQQTGTVGPLTRAALNAELGVSTAPITRNVQITPGAVIPSVPVTQPTSVPIIRALSLGAQGADVVALQTTLKKFPNIYPGGLVTGVFDTKTLNAVQAFQLTFDIVASPQDPGYGTVGPKTRTKLLELGR